MEDLENTIIGLLETVPRNGMSTNFLETDVKKSGDSK